MVRVPVPWWPACHVHHPVRLVNFVQFVVRSVVSSCFRSWFGALSFSMLTQTLSFLSWSVRGLGHSSRCDEVLSKLLSQRPTVVALQETKLQQLDPVKLKSFLPLRLSAHTARHSIGASGGILTAWDSAVCRLDSYDTGAFSLTTHLCLLADGSRFTCTNVYAPTRHADKPVFLVELADIAWAINGPWAIIGDFNLVRNAADKNNDSFDFSEAFAFNSLINNLELLEIPLLNREFTWRNKRDVPTLARLDRCLVNLAWDRVFPNTCLSALTRTASDHVPILLSPSTRVPKSACFRFENAWGRHTSFRTLLSDTIKSPGYGTEWEVFC